MTDLGLKRAEAPEQVGFSSARLELLASVVRQDVERKLIPGAVVCWRAAGGSASAEAFGFQDREAGTPMALDSIFRIASMTKPMTSVAAMMLSEEGKLEIAAPVAQYLPEFAEMTVGVERAKARRTMTVQDLLRHTSGLTYGDFGDSPVQMLWRDVQSADEGQTNAELVEKLGRLPLMFEPGTTWEYSMSTDVLGRVVEVASGMPLGEFFADAHRRAARHARHRVRRGRRARGAGRRAAGRSRRPASARRCATSNSRAAGNRAAAARYRRRPITCASARCC